MNRRSRDSNVSSMLTTSMLTTTTEIDATSTRSTRSTRPKSNARTPCVSRKNIFFPLFSIRFNQSELSFRERRRRRRRRTTQSTPLRLARRFYSVAILLKNRGGERREECMIIKIFVVEWGALPLLLLPSPKNRSKKLRI